MNKQPLLRPAESLQRPLVQTPIIDRYNIFIDTYNKPSCIFNNMRLSSLPSSKVHNFVFRDLNSSSFNWYGTILLFIFLLIPIFDILVAIACIYSVIMYWYCLNIHQQNLETVSKPEINMVYDPQLCFRMNKDFYSFSIEFKELEGFSLNYNKDMRKQLRLQEERGKANFTIYNNNFWSSFHHFSLFKRIHTIILLASISIPLVINIILFQYL